MSLFWSDNPRRPRTPWRLLLHAASVLVLGFGPVFPIAEGLTALHRRGFFLAQLSKEPYDMVVNIIVGPVMTAGVVVATLLCVRILDRRDARRFGAIPDRRWWADWIFGATLGGMLMATILLVEVSLGWARISPQARVTHLETPLTLCIAFSLTKALCVGTYEEFVSRGYHLRNLMEAFSGGGRTRLRSGVLPAVVVSSTIFSLLHGLTDNASVQSAAGLLCNGMLLAAAYVLTGRLGLCIGLHSGWNFFQGAVLGFPVSGDLEPASLWRIEQSGPSWITGAAYGPEGGLIGMLASAAGVAAIAMWVRATRSFGSDALRC